MIVGQKKCNSNRSRITNLITEVCMWIFFNNICSAIPESNISDIIRQKYVQNKNLLSRRKFEDVQKKPEFRFYWINVSYGQDCKIAIFDDRNARGCVCDSWKPSFLPRLRFNWRTFSKWVTARWWRHWARNQVSTNQNSRNRWCQIVRGTICLIENIRKSILMSFF